MRLLELLTRWRDFGRRGGGEGGSIGAIETRPAIRDTRCCDERRRGRGWEGERGNDEGLIEEGVEMPAVRGDADIAGDDGVYMDGSEVMLVVVMKGAVGVRFMIGRITCDDSTIGVFRPWFSV